MAYEGIIMRGFVVTLISMSLVTLLVAFSSSIHESHKSMERALTEPQALMYAPFLFDSIALDVNSMVGPEITFLQKNDSVTIAIADTLPKENFSAELTNYETFIETTMANQTHSFIDANFSNISPESFLLSINENYIYENTYNNPDGEMLFYSPDDTDATFYEVNILVGGVRANLTSLAFNESGDLNVSLNYMDSNGTVSESGTLFSDQVNRFRVAYENGGYLYVDVGRVRGSDGSLRIRTKNQSAEINWQTVLPPIEVDSDIGYSYNAMMEYSQGNIRMRRKIGE